jgi:hypothetical protein
MPTPIIGSHSRLGSRISEDADQAEAAEGQIDRMGRRVRPVRHDHRNDEGGQGRDAVVDAEQDADPVGPCVVGGRGRVGGPVVDRGHGGGGVDPHGEQGEPAEELDHGEAAHGLRHAEDVVDDLGQAVGDGGRRA